MKTIAIAALAAALAGGIAPAALAADVKFATSKGDIILRIDEERAPVTAENFLRYVKDGFYDGTLFHRVIPGFVIQGGGFEAGMQQKPTRDPIVNEFGNGLTNRQYSISMARLADPHSATSQFFINLANNAPLDQGAGYAVFGTVVEGQEVVDAIAAVPTGAVGPFRDVPAEDVMIERATIVE